jgi:2-polyprenyl-3-methyl-5-hydroxy-6-metoxy-1,4-benzoquinol methylase
MNKYSNNKCQCCDSSNLILAYEDSFFNLPVLKCNDCSVHFVQYDENKLDMKKYYDETYWSVFRNIDNQKIINQNVDNAYLIKKLPKIIRDIIELTGVRKSLSYSQYNYLKPYVRGHTLFELGSGEGFILELFEKKGFQVYGIEPSKVNLTIINKKLKNGKCVNGFAEDIFSIGKNFDIIIISHVLEHVVNCRIVLSNLKNILSDNGILFIEVPNCGNKKNLEHSINTQPHLHHFTKKSLQRLIEHSGYKIVRIDTFAVNVISLYEHLRYFIKWILKKDCCSLASEKEGNILRVIVTHADE